jgi:hypothetical protein
VVAVNGAQSSLYYKFALQDASKVDLRQASWSSQINIPVKIGGGDQICASGGLIKGLWDPFKTSWDTYHDTYAFVIYGNQMTVENLRVDNYGDAFNVRNDANTGHNFTITGAHVTNNHDDCVQNDSMKSGSIQDNLFDGCYNFYSSRGYGSAPNNIVKIENNVVRSQAFPTYYGGQAANLNDPSQYHNGGFFKIDEFDKAPKLSIHNNVFRVDKDSRGWVPFMPNALSISSCSNNVVVWLGSGPFPEKLPSCFTITTNKAVWDNAVADWKYRHGQGSAPVDPTLPPTPPTPPVVVTPPPVGPDTIAPKTAITSPVSGSSVLRNSVVTITASASDNVGVSAVRFYVNGYSVCTDKVAPYSCSWTVPNTLKTFNLRSRAYDAAGNSFRSAIIEVESR